MTKEYYIQLLNKDDVQRISNGLLVLRLCRDSLKPNGPFQSLGWPRRPFKGLNRPDLNVKHEHGQTGHEVIKLFSCSAQLRLKFIMLMNVI